MIEKTGAFAPRFSVAAFTLGIAMLSLWGCGGFAPDIAMKHTNQPAGLYSAIRFEPNVGQAAANYRFITHGTAHAVYLSSSEAVFELRGSRQASTRTIHATLEGAAQDLQPEAQEPLSGRVNYLIGNDSRKWHTDIPTFGRVTFRGIYPGIDVVYHGTGGSLENDFVVQPGGDPAAIRIRFTGADSVHLESDGSLAVEAGTRTLGWKTPFLYQRGEQGQLQRIEGHFQTPKDGLIGFEVGAYDLHRPLVIDPLLTYATYFGGPNAEAAARVVADDAGNAYIIGGTDNENFPSTPGTFVTRAPGVLGNVLVAKVSADGKTMIYETHIGGSNGDAGFGLALDATGNLYLTGITASADYPVVPSSNNLTTKNLTDPLNCFVTKLNSAGNALAYSTLIGGSQADGCSGVGVDSAGNAYVVGATGSTDFPLANAIQTQLPTAVFGFPSAAAFISKLSPDGSKLLYSTYVGGPGTNAATSVAVDGAGNAYFTGLTTSAAFPVTAGAVQTTFGGSGGQNSIVNTVFPSGNIFGYTVTVTFGDAFVMKMSPAGQKIYATYLGGSKDDIGFGIAIDAAGDAYVGGATLSTNFPTQNAFQSAYRGAGGNTLASGGDGFIAELDPTGGHLLFSSYLGGSADDRVLGVALDPSGNIYLAGHTLSKDFPAVGTPAQPGYAGDTNGFFSTGDAFLVEIDTTRKIAFATYLGGSAGDWAGGVAVDGQGGVIIAGATNSNNFPTNSGEYQTQYGGSDVQLGGVSVGDAFIARFGGATAAVSLSGISNAASYVGGAIAPGEAVLIAGSGIGPAALATAQLDANGNLSSSVAGTQFLFNGVAAPVVYVSSTYSSVIVPYEVSGSSTVQVVAVYNQVPSPPLTVPVVAVLPAIFSANASGTGQGAILNQNSSFNSAQSPAARGSIVTLFVTGEGQTIPAGLTGHITETQISPALPVTVSFGGVEAGSYQFIGEAPGEVAGVLQINVTVPPLAPTGSNVPVVVKVGTVNTQAGLTVAIQ